jgi:hypothetical protein
VAELNVVPAVADNGFFVAVGGEELVCVANEEAEAVENVGLDQVLLRSAVEGFLEEVVVDGEVAVREH